MGKIAIPWWVVAALLSLILLGLGLYLFGAYGAIASLLGVPLAGGAKKAQERAIKTALEREAAADSKREISSRAESAVEALQRRSALRKKRQQDQRVAAENRLAQEARTLSDDALAAKAIAEAREEIDS